jgi:DNA polymerase III subunit delta'
MKFADIPGLKDTKSLLIESVRSQHIAHAQLFAGAEGALNLPLALAYATYLHCENKGADVCETCPSCSKNLKYIHPDTHFVFPFSNIKKDKDDERLKSEILKSWRTFLLEQPFGNLDDWTNSFGGEDKQSAISREESREIIKALSLKPFESPIKVMIIWQPELMHPSAANGILKILEEPAAHTYFILVTNAADKLLPTILSRTQIITVPLLQDSDIESFLKNIPVESKKATHITHLADGNLNAAIKLVDNEDDDHAHRFAEWMRACFKKNYSGLVAFADEYHNLDRLSQKNMLLYGMNMLRESLLYQSGATSIHRLEGDELKFIQDFSKVLDVKKIDKAYGLMNDAGYHLERNGSAKMIFMDLSLQLANVIKP